MRPKRARKAGSGRLRIETVPDVKHCTIAMGKPGATLVAQRMRELLGLA